MKLCSLALFASLYALGQVAAPANSGYQTKEGRARGPRLSTILPGMPARSRANRLPPWI